MTIKMHLVTALDHGPLFGNRPRGLTLHYTANASTEATILEAGRSRAGYHYVIDRDGSITQLVDTSRFTWHAGHAFWNGKSPNIEHLAIAVVSWGILDLDEDTHTYYSYAKVAVPQSEVEWRPSNLQDTLYPWQAATEAQEDSLFTLVRSLCQKFSIKPADICDHSECALPRGRKVDIGGTLSMPMPDFRAKLEAEGIA